jgi:hypothetical protein
MPQANQVDPVTSDVSGPTIAERQYFDWPMMAVALALICTFAWNCALLWGAVYLCLILFS